MAGSKHDVLTEQEMGEFQLRPDVAACLDDCAKKFGISR